MNSSMRKWHLVGLAVLLALLPFISVSAQERIEVPASYFAGGPEQPPYGPSALRSAPNGSLWIANPSDNTLTNIDKDGWFRAQFHLADVSGITDVRIEANGELTVLDGAATTPMILTVSPDGSVRERREVRSTLPALRRSATESTNEQMQPLASSALSLEWTGQTTFDRWRLQAGSDDDPDGQLVGDNSRIDVKATRGVIRGLRILAESDKGLYVLAEEVADSGVIAVDATVRLYARSGQLLGIGRIPLTEQYSYVENPVAITGDGTAYLLITKPGTAVITKLALLPSIPEILPERHQPARAGESFNAAAGSDALPPITRTQMETNARAFLNNSTYYNQTALTGYCPGRTRPRYFGTAPRSMVSVAYDWGGGDSVADYNRLIASGYTAGDIDTNGEESCSRGVDCSGFLSRVWGLSGKYSTCTLSDVSTAISTQSLQKGDILTKCGDHVVMFESLNGTAGIYDYEATVYSGVDRVVYMPSSWSRLAGYTPRRYNNVTSTATTPVHISSTSSPASDAPGMTATFNSTWANGDGSPMTARLTIRVPSGYTYDYTMDFVSGQTTTGALFQTRLVLSGVGRYDYAVTVTSMTTGRSSRYPSSGLVTGPTVAGVTYYVSPTYPVCGQYPVNIRVGAYLATSSTVRFSVTKGNYYCAQSGYFLANGVVDLRLDSPYGAIVASKSYYAGASEVVLNVSPTFTWGSQRLYATIRNQGYWAGPITISAR